MAHLSRAVSIDPHLDHITTSYSFTTTDLAQCKTVSNAGDTSFTIGTNQTIVPGQYALAAIDGSNATTWQPLTNATANMTIDLGSSQSIKKIHFNWNANPAISFAVYGGNSSNSMITLVSGSVNITAPYNASNANTVGIKLGNVTDIALNHTVKAQYLTLSITGSFLGDGRGGTLAEVAVL